MFPIIYTSQSKDHTIQLTVIKFYTWKKNKSMEIELICNIKLTNPIYTVSIKKKLNQR